MMSQNPQKILFIKLRSLGDTILMTASLLEGMRCFPHAQIHVCVTSEWAPLLENFPGIQRIWACHRGKNKIVRAYRLIRLAFQLRKEKYDCVINLHASSSSAQLAVATGAPLRSIHFHGHRDVNRYSTQVIPGKGVLKPIIERDLDAVRALGVSMTTGGPSQLAFYKTEPEEEDAQRFMMQQGLVAPVLSLGLGASRGTKIWPYYAQLAFEWCRDHHGTVLALVGRNDQIVKQRFLLDLEALFVQFDVNAMERRVIQKKIVLLEEAPIRQVASILSKTTLWVGNDSGLKHLAVAVQIPTLTFFGPEHPFEWHPYSQDQHFYFFIDSLSCRKSGEVGMPSWCALKECDQKNHPCMSLIDVTSVVRTCVNRLKGLSTKPQDFEKRRNV